MPPPAAAPPATVAWLFLVDDLHMDFRRTGRLRSFLRELHRQLHREGELFAVATTGPSAVEPRFTSDRNGLEGSIPRITGNALRLSDYVPPRGSPRGLGEVRYRALLALESARTVMRTLEALEAQAKAIVYVSNGYDIDFAGRGAADPPAPPQWLGRDISTPRLRNAIAQLADAAAAARIPIFAIEQRATFDLDLDVSSDVWEAYFARTRASLRLLAQPTGGLLLAEGDVTAMARRLGEAVRR